MLQNTVDFLFSHKSTSLALCFGKVRMDLRSGRNFALSLALPGLFAVDPPFVDVIHNGVVQKLQPPYFLPVCIMDGIWKVFAFRGSGCAPPWRSNFQRGAAALDVDSLEQHLGDDRPEAVGQRGADLRLFAGGEHLNDAVHGLGALVVCRVPNTRWPVDAASTAREMVSRSRNSPTRMMSGSSRSAPRSAELERFGMHADFAVADDAALALVNEFNRIFYRYDMVLRVRLASSMMAASVVDLPEPVGPVTRTSPRGSWASLDSTGGSASCSQVRPVGNHQKDG